MRVNWPPPDLGFAYEVEPGAVDDGDTLPLGVGAEEDGRAKNALKSSDEAPILGTALLHAEGVQHIRRAVEGNLRCLLTNRESREEDRDEPILTPRQAETRVSGDLQNELAIASLVEQATRNWPLHRQPA
jgi:hypothetical protein